VTFGTDARVITAVPRSVGTVGGWAPHRAAWSSRTLITANPATA